MLVATDFRRSSTLNRGYVHLSTLLVLSILAPVSPSQAGFYVVAHMVNSKEALKMAINAGANAVELDLQFNPTTGAASKFHHGGFCDCTCYKVLPFSPGDGNLCNLPKPCAASTEYKEMLKYILRFPRIALVYIDSKIPLSPSIQALAARNIIETIDADLFAKGYRGKVLIGTMTERLYLKMASQYAKSSSYSSRIYFTLDNPHNDPTKAIKFMASLHVPNILVSNGNSACYPWTYHNAIRKAAVSKRLGILSGVFTWTVDKVSSFNSYYSDGASGILTNKVSLLVAWAKTKKIRLATPGDDSLPPAKTRKVMNPTCVCKHQNGGCIVSRSSPSYSACYCKSFLKIFCKGYVVACKDAKSQNCKISGTTVQHCVQGGGNCDGYNGDQCDCRRQWGGCKISKKAPVHTACKCDYWFWSCHGHVVRCVNPMSSYCRSPDTTKGSCIIGGGDCGAY